MKLNSFLLFGMLLSSSLLAQQVTNTPAPAPIETPAPAPLATNTLSTTPPAETNAPAAKNPKKKSAPRKKSGSRAAVKKNQAAELRTVPLVAGPATVIASNVNVRGQAKLNSEIVGRLTKGQEVTVLEEVTRNNSGPDEPSAWAKILLPPGVHVWVNTAYITNNTVKSRRLNVRGGPGENYSILGRMERGEPVKELGTKGEWTEIEAPTNGYAFMAAQYLKQEAPGTAPATPEPPTQPATVSEPPTIATAPVETPSTPTPPSEPSAATNAAPETALSSTNEPPPATTEPPPKRIVLREGLVRGTFSIQAPTKFELVSPETGKTMDYLYTSSPNLDLRRYKGLRIVVTGEEGLEERWGNTPIITIQKIQVLE